MSNIRFSCMIKKKKKTDFHDNKCVETESKCINNLNDDSCENDKKTVKL